MKQNTLKTSFFLLSFCFAWTTKAHVELDYPAGGELFSPGQTITIEWHETVSHNTMNWDLYFSADGGSSWDTIKMDISVESRSFQWVIPGIPTTQGQIMVVQDNVVVDYEDVCAEFTIQDTATSVEESRKTTISSLSLYPNPFFDQATIAVSLDKTARLDLIMYNALGQRVAILESGLLSPGSYTYDWCADELPAGVYLLRAQAGKAVVVRRLMLIK